MLLLSDVGHLSVSECLFYAQLFLSETPTSVTQFLNDIVIDHEGKLQNRKVIEQWLKG
jgi:hypothetical protein